MRFIALFAFVLLCALPARADRFEFPDEGFVIDGPEGWVILTISDLNRVHRDADFGTEELNRNILSSDPAHLLSISTTLTPRGVAPGLHLFYRPGRLDDPNVYLDQLLGYLSQNASQFRRLSGPRRIRLAGTAAGTTTYQYTAVSNGVGLIVEETVWVIPMGSHFLMMSSGTAPDDAKGKREIRETIASLRLLK